MGHGNDSYGGGSFGTSGVDASRLNIGWDLASFPAREYPFPPLNVQIMSPMFRGAFDLRWDKPTVLSSNSPWCVIGVNIYRSDTGERGPYHRLNSYPLGGRFYRDLVDNALVSNEVVAWGSSWVYRGDGPNNPRWVFRTRHPISKAYSDRFLPGSSYRDVELSINGVHVPVHGVFGQSGEVELINYTYQNNFTGEKVGPLLPDSDSTVLVTYRTNCNNLDPTLDRKIFYRIATVAEDPANPGVLVETPLRYCPPATHHRVESLDYMWREAIRRNRWILEQGGERVKVFIQKRSGVPCDCTLDARRRAYTKQPLNDCLQCYGTGFEGGYEGPYEMIIGPDEAEKAIRQTPWGRHTSHTYDVWTGPTPLLTQRDFIVKQTGERYSIGPVKRDSNRGNIMQQAFSIFLLDDPDVRYELNVESLALLDWPENRTTINEEERIIRYSYDEQGPPNALEPSEHDPQVHPVDADYQATPMGTEKRNIDDSRELRGRTQTWSNQNY